MVKILVSFSEPQIAWLREEAARLGISVSELVRRFVDANRLPAPRKGNR